MLTSHPCKRLDFLLLLLVLSVAGALRLGHSGVVSFQYDEALISHNVLDMLETHALRLTGQPSSVGIPASPMSLYLLAIPYSMSSSPLTATVFIAALNTLGVGLLFVLARRYLNRTVALGAGLAFATNPWAVLYSRKIWEPNLFTPLLILAMLLALIGYLEQPSPARRRRQQAAQVVFWPALLAGIQIHFAAWTLLPLFLLVVFLGRRQIAWRATLVGLAFGLTLLVPFAVGLVQSYQDNPQPFQDIGGGDDGALSLRAEALRITRDYATGTGLLRMVGFASKTRADLWTLDRWWALIGLVALIGALGLAVRGWRIMTVIAILWVALPFTVFTPSWTRLSEHYFVGTLPGLALLTGLGAGVIVTWSTGRRAAAEQVPARRHRTGVAIQLILTSLLIALLASQGAWWLQVIDTADRVATTGDLNRPLHRLIAIADRLAPYDNVIVVSNAYWQDYNEEPQIWRVLLRESTGCLRAIGPDGFAVFPNGPFAVLTTPAAGEQPVNDLYRTAGRETIALRQGEGAYTIDVLDAPLAWPGPALTAIAPASFDNGIRLTGTYLDAERMILEWDIQRSGGKNFQYFGHFLDANGNRIGQRDTTFVPGTYRCAGDRVVTWTDIALPPEATTLRVGMYHLWLDRAEGPFYPASVIDEAGNPIGQTVDIPLE